jgi:hypothetical protein
MSKVINQPFLSSSIDCQEQMKKRFDTNFEACSRARLRKQAEDKAWDRRFGIVVIVVISLAQDL